MPSSPIVFLAIIFAILFIKRRSELRDDFGNPTAHLYRMAGACLAIGIMFSMEAVKHRDDQFYLRHPENFYVLFGFIAFSVLAAVGMFRARITLLHDRIVDHSPPFWHKELPLRSLVAIDGDSKVTVLRFGDRRKISIPHMYESSAGLIAEIRKRTNIAEAP